jgi:hypothetical protein
MSSSLNYISNRCLTLGTFPSCLKYTEIKPLFKNGDRNVISNYRSVALLTSFSEVLAKVIFERLCRRVNNNSIISKKQY